MAKDEGGKPEGATAEQLAQLFDCTPRQIQLWAKQGICVRLGHGRYNAAESTRNVVRHLREQAAGRAGVDRDTDVVAANKERSLEQAKFFRAKREALEGTQVPVDEVREWWGRILRGLRQAVLGLPRAIAFEVPTLTPHDVKTIRKMVDDLLTDASIGKHVEAPGNEQLPHNAPRRRKSSAAGAASTNYTG